MSDNPTQPRLKRFLVTLEKQSEGHHIYPPFYVPPTECYTREEAEDEAFKMAAQAHFDVAIYEKVASVISKPEIVRE